MVLFPIKCPHCGSVDVVKNGHYPNGQQRYKCKNPDCPHSVFMSEYSYNACIPGIEKEVLRLTVDGNGTRAISRLLKISTNTVTAILQKKRSNHPTN